MKGHHLRKIGVALIILSFAMVLSFYLFITPEENPSLTSNDTYYVHYLSVGSFKIRLSSFSSPLSMDRMGGLLSIAIALLVLGVTLVIGSRLIRFKEEN
jgi:hypothetical protein